MKKIFIEKLNKLYKKLNNGTDIKFGDGAGYIASIMHQSFILNADNKNTVLPKAAIDDLVILWEVSWSSQPDVDQPPNNRV